MVGDGVVGSGGSTAGGVDGARGSATSTVGWVSEDGAAKPSTIAEKAAALQSTFTFVELFGRSHSRMRPGTKQSTNPIRIAGHDTSHDGRPDDAVPGAAGTGCEILVRASGGGRGATVLTCCVQAEPSQ